MRPFHFAAERLVEAPAPVVYHCLSDYLAHHRHQPEGFLPTAFTRLEVLEGGVGAGTLIRFTTRVGGNSVTRTQRVTEPEPGRVLVESGNGEGSTFTVEPRGEGRAWVRIDTVMVAGGIQAVAMQLFGKRIVDGLFADELNRLEQYAQAHARNAVGNAA